MVLGMTTSRDVPNNQHGQGHLVGMEFTTMDLLSHWSQGWRSGYGTFHFLAQTELLSSALLVPGSNQIWKSSKLILSPTLPDHRGCLTGGTCCSGVELPAPQVGLGAACFPFLAAKVHWQHHHFSHLADGSSLEDKEASALCWRSRHPPPHPSQTLLGELPFPPNPHEVPLLPGTKSLSDPKPASPPMDAPWISRSWSRQQSSPPTWSSWWALQPVVGLQCCV